MNEANGNLKQTRLTLVFDGECWFCRVWVHQFQNWTTGSEESPVTFEEYQNLEGRFSPWGEKDFSQGIHAFDPEGKFLGRGALAAFWVLSCAAPQRWGVRFLGRALRLIHQRNKLFRYSVEALYDAVAKNRKWASRITIALMGEDFGRPSYGYARGLWVRGLGVVSLMAFASLSVQVAGLIGEEGILPGRDFMDHVRVQIPDLIQQLFFFPSLGLFWNSTRAIETFTWVGALSSLLMIANRSQRLSCWATFIAFLAYLSLTHLGQDFLSFQWDALLLECLFFTFILLLAPKPSVFCIGKCAPYDSGFERNFRWVFLAIFAKLLFLSGLSKVLSGDPAWSGGSALAFHFQTQPLPTALSPLLHRGFNGLGTLGDAFSLLVKGISYAVILLELSAPLWVLSPRRLRQFAFLLFTALQTVIALSGNFGFFNFLSLLLGIWLWDDRCWRGFSNSFLFPAFFRDILLKSVFLKPRVLPLRQSWVFRKWGTRAALLCGAVVLLPALHSSSFAPIEWALGRMGISHRYGLFAVMTQERREVIFETSEDGQNWTELEFKFKPGGLDRPLAFLPGHMPRLDWQLWFSALGPIDQSPWVFEFAERILQGTPEVLDLLEGKTRIHLTAHRPRLIRAHLYRYEFQESSSSPDPWKRTLVEPLWLPSQELSKRSPQAPPEETELENETKP